MAARSGPAPARPARHNNQVAGWLFGPAVPGPFPCPMLACLTVYLLLRYVHVRLLATHGVVDICGSGSVGACWGIEMMTGSACLGQLTKRSHQKACPNASALPFSMSGIPTLPWLPIRGRVFRFECAKAGQCFEPVLSLAKSAIYLRVGGAVARSERPTCGQNGLRAALEATKWSLLRLSRPGMGSFECG